MKMNKLLLMGLAMTTAISMPVFAASGLTNSTASTAADATKVSGTDTMDGQDTNQSKETLYSDEITEDKSETCEVYATQASTFSVIIPKTIILDGAKDAADGNIGKYVVTVKGNIGGAEIVSVTPDATFKMSQAGKDDIDATVTQAITDFRVEDAALLEGADTTKTVYGVDKAEGVTTDGTVEVSNLSAGSWSGQFAFNIAIN